MKKPILLIIDDEPAIADLCKEIAQSLGFDTEICTDIKINNTLIDPHSPPDAILMDLVMPDTEGMELLQWLSQIHCTSKLIIMSGYGDKYLKPAQLYAESCDLDFYAILPKPFSIADLKNILKSLLE